MLGKATEQVAAKKFEDSALLADRLYPDMFAFARQIRQATDFARNTPGRLAGVTPPHFAATDDTTLAAARDRVERSMAFVKSINAAQIEGTEDKDNISWTAGGTQRTMKGRAGCTSACRTSGSTATACNILRHRAIENWQARRPGDILGL